MCRERAKEGDFQGHTIATEELEREPFIGE
jgi:hypothetical protein